MGEEAAEEALLAEAVTKSASPKPGEFWWGEEVPEGLASEAGKGKGSRGGG